MFKNRNGFSLLQVVIASGILGGMAVVVMKLMSNMAQINTTSASKTDEIAFRSAVQILLQAQKHCRVSVAGDGTYGSPTNPVTFRKSDIDEDDEGLPIALYYANQDGTARLTKMFNGRDDNPGGEDKSVVGKLVLKSMKLHMNNGTGFDYTDMPVFTDPGVIRVIADKQIQAGKSREVTFDFNVNVVLTTGQPPEASGESRIISCYIENFNAVNMTQSFTIGAPYGVNSNSLNMGTWKFCSLSGSSTTAGDDNNFDGCRVTGAYASDWTLYVQKAAEDTLTCWAHCFR